jgi:hypothetical protein
MTYFKRVLFNVLLATRLCLANIYVAVNHWVVGAILKLTSWPTSFWAAVQLRALPPLTGSTGDRVLD